MLSHLQTNIYNAKTHTHNTPTHTHIHIHILMCVYAQTNAILTHTHILIPYIQHLMLCTHVNYMKVNFASA